MEVTNNQNNIAANTDAMIPLISYNCTAYLLQNNELVWKLLKYQTADAWNKTNLTSAEKSALIYRGGNPDTMYDDYHIFFDDFQDDGINTETTFLRIFPMEDSPQTHLVTDVAICMVVYTHSKCNHLSNYQTRVETIIQQLKETFNEKEIPKLGMLTYSQQASRLCKSMIIGKVPYKGKVVIFHARSVSVRSGCQ